MTVSATYSRTAGDMVRLSLRAAGIIAVEQPVEAIDLTTGLEALSIILKSWQAQGLHLWGKQEYVLPMLTSRQVYDIGPGDAVAISAATAADPPQITAPGHKLVNGQSISIVDVEGMTDLNGNTYTVASADRAAGTFTLSGVIGAGFGAWTAGGTVTYIGDHCAEAETFVKTTSSAAHVLDDAAITVTSSAGMDVGDRFGLEMDDASIFWTSILTIDSPTQVTLDSGLPSASASGLTVFSYETAADRFQRVLSVRSSDTFSSSETDVEMVSRDEYFAQPGKDSQGTVVWSYYSPQLTQGRMYTWQVARNVKQILRITAERPLKVPGNQTDQIDVPSEWYEPLKWALAAEIAPEYEVKIEEQSRLEFKADKAMELVLGHDVERDSMCVELDFD